MNKADLDEATACCPCCNLRKAARAISSFYDRLLSPTGLRCTQIILLGTVHALGPVSVKELAQAIELDRTTLTRNLKVLEKRGLIRIVPGQDLRVREISLTDKGQELFHAALPLWESGRDYIAEHLGPERFARLLSDLSATIDIASAGQTS